MFNDKDNVIIETIIFIAIILILALLLIFYLNGERVKEIISKETVEIEILDKYIQSNFMFNSKIMTQRQDYYIKFKYNGLTFTQICQKEIYDFFEIGEKINAIKLEIKLRNGTTQTKFNFYTNVN